MKKQVFAAGFILAFAAELIALAVFAFQTPNFALDTVAVNEIVRTVTLDFDNMQTHKNATNLDYVVLDLDGNVLYKTKSGLSESVNAAVAHRDTMLDISPNGTGAGKVIIYNDSAQALKKQKQTAIAVLSAAAIIQCVICVCYFAFMHVSIVKPFKKLKGFAERVACGNLDIPLEMDKRNVFGAFTESFDIMRHELKRARISEAQAQKSKKELVAKLSHDIKTPVASIKAVSEVGAAVASTEKDKANYAGIIGKADQINTLVTNLFSATLEELEQLAVSPQNIESASIKTMLENADYLNRASIPALPDCLIHADALRLQQVFDNVFANSYKYADTDIAVSAEKGESGISIIIEDFGGGVRVEELPVLKEKFKRGSNAEHVEGAGLGLYISDYFMKEMGGELQVKNGERGLQVTVRLTLSGKI